MDSRDQPRDRGDLRGLRPLPDRAVYVLGFLAGLVAIVLAMWAAGDPSPVPAAPPEPPAVEAPTIEAPTWAPGEALSEEALVWILGQAGAEPADVGGLVAISWCESRWRPWVRNASGAAGLFQLMPMWFAYAGYPLESWADPMVNARVAVLVVAYDRGQGHPFGYQWVCKP